MSIITLLIGNVGCGKSFFASKLAKLFGDVVINMDDLQQNMSGGQYNAYDPEKKQIYHDIENEMIRATLRNGRSVVIDRASNTTKATRKRFIDIAKEFNANVMAYDWGPGTIAQLKRRQENSRDHSPEKWAEVWKKIRDQYENINPKEEDISVLKPPEKYQFHAFDFDGTLAETVSHDDFPACGKPIEENVSLVKKLYESMENVIIIWTCRGGSDKLGPMYEWLKNNHVPYDFVNENPLVNRQGSPKIYATFYYDDRAKEI